MKPILTFDDAGADDDHPARGITVGDIRAWHDENERLRTALANLRRSHFVLEEDCWYSCPKSGECCDDKADKTQCNCGADQHNAIIDATLAKAP